MFSHQKKYYFIIFLIVYSFANITVLNGDRLYKANLPSEYLFIVLTYLCFGVWFINYSIEKYVISRIRGIHPLLSQFMLSVGGIMVLTLFSVLLTSTLFGSPFSFQLKNVTLTAAFLFRVNLFLNSINAVYYFSNKLQQKEIEAEKFRMANLSAKYEVLNNQVNPHFLFNNLNTLSSLLHIDVQKADLFLHKLSDSYRYILKNKGNELVSLKEEVDFIKEYSELLMIRFDKSLKIIIDIPEEKMGMQLPPTVLQLLIENVVKHNFFTEDDPITVTLESEGLNLIISNNLQTKKSDHYSSGIGLKNISQRYEFFGEEIEIDHQETIFKVTVPLLNIQ